MHKQCRACGESEEIKPFQRGESCLSCQSPSVKVYSARSRSEALGMTRGCAQRSATRPEGPDVATAEAPYNMSFTAGALLYRESMVVARLAGETSDWDGVKRQVLANNLLQMRTPSASQRIFREVTARLQQLSPAQSRLLSSGSRPEQNLLLWLAICKRYRFIREFAVEVVREKYLRLDRAVLYADYDVFFNAKAEWHGEVERLAPSTRSKLRQIVFRMLREAEMLTADNYIVPVVMTPQLAAAIAGTIRLTSPSSPWQHPSSQDQCHDRIP